MNQEKLNQEVLECSRYGEDEDLRAILAAGGHVNHIDHAGNTGELITLTQTCYVLHATGISSTLADIPCSGLHRASANGHVSCINVLLDHGAQHITNASGNYPIHWAAQNGQFEALKTLLSRCPDCDVLAQNSFGRSVMTEAFDSKNQDVIEICLSHPSAAEDRMLSNTAKDVSKDSIKEEENEDEDAANASSSDAEAEAIHHEFNFNPNLSSQLIKIRELPIARADNPFGSDARPEDDTTGLGIWPASLLAARWLAMSRELRILIQNKVFLELGAGCGVPGIAAGKCGMAVAFFLRHYD
jgi:uncharacterized protein